MIRQGTILVRASELATATAIDITARLLRGGYNIDGILQTLSIWLFAEGTTTLDANTAMTLIGRIHPETAAVANDSTGPLVVTGTGSAIFRVADYQHLMAPGASRTGATNLGAGVIATLARGTTAAGYYAQIDWAQVMPNPRPVFITSTGTGVPSVQAT